MRAADQIATRLLGLITHPSPLSKDKHNEVQQHLPSRNPGLPEVCGVVAEECGSIVPRFAADSLGVKVTPMGAVPTDTTDAGSYNMAVAENFKDMLIFIDQKKGILYSYASPESPPNSSSRSKASKASSKYGQYAPPSSEVKKIYDAKLDPLPEGVDVDDVGPYVPFSNGINKIQQVAPGPDDDSIIVMFTSATLPSSYRVVANTSCRT